MLALLFTLQGLGESILFPFPAQAVPETAVAIHIEDGRPSAFIDSIEERIVFLNSAHEVAAIERLNDSSLLTKAYDLTCDGQYFYVLGAKN